MDKKAPAKVRFVCPQNGARVLCPVCNCPFWHQREEWAWPNARIACEAHAEPVPLVRGDRSADCPQCMKGIGTHGHAVLDLADGWGC